MLNKFEPVGDKKTEKKRVLGEKLESMNYKGSILCCLLGTGSAELF